MISTSSLQKQQTLANSISCRGIGLHSGVDVDLTLHPAEEDSGILFHRSDVKGFNNKVNALYNNVSQTNLGTTLSNEDGTLVSTVEHVMAAFWGCGVDNAVVEINGPEVPIMDGSSEPFVFLVECAGIKEQSSPRKIIEARKPIKVGSDDKYMEITPADDFSVELTVDYGDGVITKQNSVFDLKQFSFKNDLCRARSFCFEHEVDALRKQGLALGGSLDNAIVVGDKGVLNKEGLRYRNEFVRHKILDCVGDFFLTGGAFLKGRFSGYKTGHALNNNLLREFFADKDAWQLVSGS